ncbi:DUF732 domain-containing protein [Streptomyces sp. NPDC049915]|uniref:DUF732 domain-containing protein n=1 Tax=Streptomyces sp. NPDC049915 TaxID=3155510 RepID=UPI0034237A44
MRRKITTVAGALLAGLVLAGCSSSGPSADDEKYADAVAAADPYDFGDMETDQLADTLGSNGTDICVALKGGSYGDAMQYAIFRNFDPKQAAALVSAAVLVYCPDQAGKLPAA